MKTVLLRMPFDGKWFTIQSSERDMIVGGIETNQGLYEPHLMIFFKAVLQPHFVCLDIGANVGAISLALGYLTPYGKVYALEPAEQNFRYLQQNIAGNGAFNIEPVQLGAYDQNTKLAFSYIDFGGGWSHITTPQAKAGIQETVDCVRIDDWARERGVDRIDFIKLDVEGAEINALRGAMETILRLKPDLIVEFNPKAHTSIFGEDPYPLFVMLTHLYPHMYLINFDNNVIKIRDYPHLMEFYRDGREVSDLYCTWKQ